jgi:thymidylate synthase (FAD)
MKLIKQSFEILEQKDFSLVGIKKFIERCGRVCYKSEDKITDNSYEKFVDMLVKRGHARPLEFGTVHFKVCSGPVFEEILHDLVDCELYNPVWIKYKELPEHTYITTNYRHYLQIIKKCPYIAEYFTEQDNCYYPSRYTVHFITSRVTMDSFRTHISLSHLGESTRYCNYNKDKFDNQLTFIIPDRYDIEECDKYTATDFYTSEDLTELNPKYNWLNAMMNSEMLYMRLLKLKESPQYARGVLPLDVKSELISCGFKDAWDNFFDKRCANDAHPMAREIATAVRNKLQTLW